MKDFVIGVIRLVSACFLTAAFLFLFLSVSTHIRVADYKAGFTDCLLQVPGVQPESIVAKSSNPSN